MVSEDDYEGLMETVHLLRSSANATRLLEFIAQANTGALTEHDVVESKEAAASAT